jgi:16S rRNA (uracil1498-N3)-methyltransferase
MSPDLWPVWENGVSARFYCPDPPRDGKLRLLADEARHLSRVCRFGVGDVVEVFDGNGGASRAQVVKIDNDCVELTVVGAATPDRPAPLRLTLASAVPKGDRFDWLVEKATELGIERMIPIVTERSVVTPGDPKLERLRRAIVEASKQCGRNQLMVLEPPSQWEHLVGTCPGAIKLLADPTGIPPRRWPGITPGSLVVLAVGPEGGFTDQERQIADQMGWLAISLSVNTLRIETAGLAGCAALLTHVKELDP